MTSRTVLFLRVVSALRTVVASSTLAFRGSQLSSSTEVSGWTRERSFSYRTVLSARTVAGACNATSPEVTDLSIAAHFQLQLSGHVIAVVAWRTGNAVRGVACARIINNLACRTVSGLVVDTVLILCTFA